MLEALFPTRWKHDKPPSLERFMADFPDDYACAEHLAERRWPDGFVCPCCGSKKGWRLEAKPWVWECSGKGSDPCCRKQTSVIAGTVMHGTHLPMRTWFIAAYLVATHSNGISALQLQPKIGVGSYKTAWLLLHKLRRAMVAPDRTPLEGDVEIDETSIPFRRADEAPTGGQGKSTIGKMFIIGAVEKRSGRSAGRIRLQRIPEDTGRYIRPFVEANTAPGSAIYTDANTSYLGIPNRTHVRRNLSARNELPAHITFERIHRVFSNLKRWALGTYHGLRDKHVDTYLNEFVFRWNRRRLYQHAMGRMLGIGQSLPPTTYREIVGDTSAWKAERAGKILAMVAPERREAATQIAGLHGISVIKALELVPAASDRRGYERRLPERPVLAPRREGERRCTARYRHPPRPTRSEVERGMFRHMRETT